MPTILVADDNSNIQKMVSLAFQEKGIRVVAVGNGEAACRKVPEVRPDVVLADVFMPVRNGYEVCEFVKKDPEFAETPVILLVGAFDPLDEKEAARVGADGVLKKPFVPPEPLISMVNSLLGRDAPAEQETQEARPAASAAPIEVPPEWSKAQYSTPRPEPPRPPQEFAFGSDGDDGVETPPNSSEPVAGPAVNTAQQTESADDDDLGPENAWVQRRKAMDYEIDVSDSADLVERLAGTKSESGDSSEEDGILASDKHVPFGGANVPEIPPAPKWADFLKRKADTAAEPVESHAEVSPAPEPSAPAESYTYDSTPPDLDVPSSKSEMAGELAPSELLSSGENVTPYQPPIQSLPEGSAQDEADEPKPSEATGDSDVIEITASESSKAPESEIEASASPENWFDKLTKTASESRSAEAEAPGEKMEALQEEVLPPPSSEGIESEATAEAATLGTQPADGDEPVATSSNSHANDGLVDDVVAKVISKLEPQLHQALKDGVLKPLVEELLNEKRGKK